MTTTRQIKKPVYYMFEYGRQMLERDLGEALEEFNHMDLFGFNPETRESCEIEIKTADYDFYKEFKKPSKVKKHAQYMHEFIHKERKFFCPTRFYFFVLSNFTDRALKKLEKKELPYGLIEYNSLKGTVRVVKKSEKLTDNPWLGELQELPGRDFKHKRTVCI